MASPQVECVSPVIVTRLVPSRLTVMRTVSAGVSRASQDPNVTGAHEDTSTSRRVAAHVSIDSGEERRVLTESKLVDLACIYVVICSESYVSNPEGSPY